MIIFIPNAQKCWLKRVILLNDLNEKNMVRIRLKKGEIISDILLSNVHIYPKCPKMFTKESNFVKWYLLSFFRGQNKVDGWVQKLKTNYIYPCFQTILHGQPGEGNGGGHHGRGPTVQEAGQRVGGQQRSALPDIRRCSRILSFKIRSISCSSKANFTRSVEDQDPKRVENIIILSSFFDNCRQN